MISYQNGTDVQYNELICKNCGAELEVTCYLQSGFVDFEKLYCPDCGEYIGEFRSDRYCMVRRISRNEQEK